MYIQSRYLSLFVLLLALVAAIASGGCDRRKDQALERPRPAPQDTTTIEPIVRDSIVKYVEETKGWDRKRYVIQIYERSETMPQYLVGHLDDVEHPRMGGGLSFVVVFDRAELRVVREFGFQ
jgi:hypothetical protein